MIIQKPQLGELPDWSLFPQPILLLLFNEGSGNKVFDLSGNGGTGILTGTAPTWGVGEYGPVVNLPSTNEYINVLHKPVYDMPFPCTIFGRIKPAEAETTQNIITTHTWSGTYYGYTIHLLGGTAIQASYGDGTGAAPGDRKTKLGTTALVNGVWYDFAVVFHSAADFTIYLDAKDDGGSYSGSAVAVAFNTSPLKIGFDDGTTDYFNGDVDFIGMVSRGYTASQIAQLHQNPFPWFRRDPIELWAAAQEAAGIVVLRRRIEAA